MNTERDCHILIISKAVAQNAPSGRNFSGGIETKCLDWLKTLMDHKSFSLRPVIVNRSAFIEQFNKWRSYGKYLAAISGSAAVD